MCADAGVRRARGGRRPRAGDHDGIDRRQGGRHPKSRRARRDGHGDDAAGTADVHHRFRRRVLRAVPHARVTTQVKVELQGFRTLDRQNIDVRLGQRVELTLPLQVGALTESVNVTGAPPVVDASSTTTGAVLDSEMLQRAAGRPPFSDTLYIAPGVSSGGQVGDANPSVSGGSGLENQYVVDGVNITNAGYGALGSYSIVFGSLGNGVPFDFIKETQVKTGGYEAEYGQSTGGVVNVVTKSGTNTLRGSVFGYFRPDALESSYRPGDDARTAPST